MGSDLKHLDEKGTKLSQSHTRKVYRGFQGLKVPQKVVDADHLEDFLYFCEFLSSC